MNNESMYIWLEDYEEKTEKIEKESWEQLDLVVRKWAVLSGHEKDQSSYQKMKEMYQ